MFVYDLTAVWWSHWERNKAKKYFAALSVIFLLFLSARPTRTFTIEPRIRQDKHTKFPKDRPYPTVDTLKILSRNAEFCRKLNPRILSRKTVNSPPHFFNPQVFYRTHLLTLLVRVYTPKFRFKGTHGHNGSQLKTSFLSLRSY